MSVKLTGEIMDIFAVELVVREQEEGGDIVAFTSLPEFKPPPGHQMSSVQFPPEALSILGKLQISFKGGKGPLSKSPLIN